ncbi:trafficking protein particle complex subunit 12 [Neodiprion fabricii]|uniref:trafficking protein particle complex subunit 12 n=1 Tax=Neodiprion fabricii TaxID=2872261 RepID=UPI001ED8C01A|nr:trafficking protein particle complex subunit 12 [Neodiprion fabricii]
MADKSSLFQLSDNIAGLSDDSKPSGDTGLGRYFSNTTHTIFDEIVPPEKQDMLEQPSASASPRPVFDSFLTDPSNSFLDNSLSDAAEQVSDHVTASDIHRDAWIPSDQTKKVLASIATSTPGSNFPDRENLTMPGLTLQGDLTDTTKEAAIHFLGEEENIHRNVLTASDVTQDERGLRNLIQTGCYRAAINLTGRLLAIYGQGYGKINHPSKHTPHSLQLWFTRLALLAKLKHVEVLENESKPFGNLDKPDMFFTFYPELYGTRPGSMACFAFRLLLAEIPAYCNKPRVALDNLHKVLSTVKQIIKNLKKGFGEDGGRLKFTPTERDDAIRLWVGRESRVLISIVNCALTLKNYILAVDILESLSEGTDWNPEQRQILKSAISRVLLLLGDVSAAEKQFADGRESFQNPSNSKELTDRGLMAVAQNAFQEAYNCFKKASVLEPSNIMLVNNMAVCLLYNGQLQAAVHLLESALVRNPTKGLQEALLLNICTLYELHTTHSTQPKLHLLRQLNRYKGDAIAVQCLKLSL